MSFFPPEGVTDPSKGEWVLDQGDGLKTALQLKDESIAEPRVLVPKLAGGAPAIAMPAAAMDLSAPAWTLSLTLKMPAGSSGNIFERGPQPFTHVPGDTTFSVQPAGNMMLDIGWSLALIGTMHVNDGNTHDIVVSHRKHVISLMIDGKHDATISHSLGINTGATWRLTFSSPPVGALVEGLKFAASESKAVKYLTFENVHIAHVGWSSFGDFQSASYLDTAAVHLRNASHIVFRNCSVSHVGGYAMWVEGGSSNVLIDHSLIQDVSGGVRIGRGTPLSAEPMATRTHDVRVHNSRITGGALVYREAAGVLAQNADSISLTHSEVSYFNHVAVSFGWVWGFSPRAGRDNQILFNLVHHVGNDDLSDLGGICKCECECNCQTPNSCRLVYMLFCMLHVVCCKLCWWFNPGFAVSSL